MTEIEGIKFYSIQEVTEKLKTHINTVRNYIKRGTLKGRKIKGVWYISEEHFLNFLKGSDN